MPERLTPKREREILEAYEAWDPEKETLGQLAKRLQTSRQMIYTLLRRHNIVPKTQRYSGSDQMTPAGQVLSDELIDKMASQALRFLLDELEATKRYVAELEEELGRRERPTER